MRNSKKDCWTEWTAWGPHLQRHKYGWPDPYIVRYLRCIYGIFGREITIHTVIYSGDIKFWPTLDINIHRCAL
jgi:hypothetical protein